MQVSLINDGPVTIQMDSKIGSKLSWNTFGACLRRVAYHINKVINRYSPLLLAQFQRWFSPLLVCFPPGPKFLYRVHCHDSLRRALGVCVCPHRLGVYLLSPRCRSTNRQGLLPYRPFGGSGAGRGSAFAGPQKPFSKGLGFKKTTAVPQDRRVGNLLCRMAMTAFAMLCGLGGVSPKAEAMAP